MITLAIDEEATGRKRQLPTLAEEIKLGERGYDLIAGIDEVGRGPLAGPLLAAAIILPANTSQPWMEMVQDSKRLLPKKREFLCRHLQETALAIGIGSVPPQYIDVYGIVMATRMAMSMAVRNLPTPPPIPPHRCLYHPRGEIASKRDSPWRCHMPLHSLSLHNSQGNQGQDHG